MPLQKTIEVVNQLARDGVIGQYAIAGAVAALYYIEPTLTEDLDILVSIAGFEERGSGLILLTPIENALTKLGYTERKDVGIVVEGWPVQFLPVASELDVEALRDAEEVEFQVPGEGPIRTRILSAEYIVANAVKLGRLKDLVRADAFLQRKAVNLPALKQLLERHALMPAWKEFCFKSGKSDPLG